MFLFNSLFKQLLPYWADISRELVIIHKYLLRLIVLLNCLLLSALSAD